MANAIAKESYQTSKTGTLVSEGPGELRKIRRWMVYVEKGVKDL